MNINEMVKSVADSIENFDNSERKTWGEVFRKELDSLNDLTSEEKNMVLVKVVKELTHRGYSIEDDPFKLVKF